MSASESVATGPPHTIESAALFASLGSDPERGLSTPRARELLQRHGPNQLAEAPPVPAWRRFLAQFQELVILILIAAAVIAGALGEWADTLAIAAIVILNGLLGFVQEDRAGRALAALRKMSSPVAKVIRDGRIHTLPASELVPGDLIELEAGDSVPADARLLRGFGLKVQEAALTGESVPVEKDADATPAAATPLGDRLNMVYFGTVVASGKTRALVSSTGMSTELGKIAGLLHQGTPEPTPLQRRLSGLGKTLVAVCLSAVVLIFILQIARGDRIVEAFLIAVSLAVAAVPEGLPAVVTMALALGLQRMVARNALVRKLPSVETLGSVTVICSDKTGTLTRNEMTVREFAADGFRYEVTGSGYHPRGDFRRDGVTVDPKGEDGLGRALKVSAWCNNAKVVPKGQGDEGWQVIGDPTEGALVVAALKAEIEASAPDERLILEIPFDSDRKTMSVVVREADGSALMLSKGAPEILLRESTREWRDGEEVPLTDDRRREIMAENSEMAGRALRVLALADRRFPDADAGRFEESDLTFAGLVGMIDPPRDEAREAVRRCRMAGIRPVMITGDHPETAMAIAQELGLAAEGERALTGLKLDEMDDDALRGAVVDTPVYARVSAEHKLRVVRAWKKRGEIVAMTGDGVNDAPAVDAADIGIAMGITGTDVTKEASDMVLTDDNFASIVNAVEEGRGIFDNIQKFVLFLLSCNAGEVLVMLFAAVVGWPAPLTAIQILWVNLVTDGLPALALGMEPPEPDVMDRPPRPPQEPVITWGRGMTILFYGSLVATVTGVGFGITYDESDPESVEHARAMALMVLAFSQLFFAFGCRSQRYTLPQLGFFTNPYLFLAVAVSGLLQASLVLLPFTLSVFDLTTYPAQEWLTVLLLSIVPVTVIEVLKIVRAALRKAAPAV